MGVDSLPRKSDAELLLLIRPTSSPVVFNRAMAALIKSAQRCISIVYGRVADNPGAIGKSFTVDREAEASCL